MWQPITGRRIDSEPSFVGPSVSSHCGSSMTVEMVCSEAYKRALYPQAGVHTVTL